MKEFDLLKHGSRMRKLQENVPYGTQTFILRVMVRSDLVAGVLLLLVI